MHHSRSFTYWGDLVYHAPLTNMTRASLQELPYWNTALCAAYHTWYIRKERTTTGAGDEEPPYPLPSLSSLFWAS